MKYFSQTFFTLVFSWMILASAGWPQLVYAVSCNDVVDQATGTRYSDALTSFFYFGDKTYAAVMPGNNYFAFDANITREYLLDGVDTNSLKKQIQTGSRYGDAKPLLLSSEAVRDFIVEYYGDALAAGNTYIDAWREYGSSTFTSMAGAALPFVDWLSTPAESTIPSAVLMDRFGKMLPATTGAATAQIVEFNGKLDCALDLNPTDPPPDDPDDPPGDPHAIHGVVCSQDINNNGYVGEVGEIASCLDTPQGNFCPVGALDCGTTYQPPTCPDGSLMNYDRDMCQADHLSVACPVGYVWDASLDRCTNIPSCVDGGVLNQATDLCEKVVADTVCPAGYQLITTTPFISFDPALSRPSIKLCIKSADCPTNSALNPATGRCEVALGTCAGDYVLNPATNRCELSPPTCPDGSTYSATYDKCMKPVVVCADGYTWNTTRERCEMLPVCPEGSIYNAAQNKCTTDQTNITGYSTATLRDTIIKFKARNDYNPATWSTTAPALDNVVFTFHWDGSQVTLQKVDAFGGAGQCAPNSPSWEWQCPLGDPVVQSYDANGKLTVSETYYVWTTAYDEYGTVIDQSKSYSLGGAATSAAPSEFSTCPAGYTTTTAPNPDQCVQILTQWGNYSGLTDCSNAGAYTCAKTVAACPAGSTLADGVCVIANPTCTGGGVLDGVNDVCFYAATACEEDWTYDVAAGQCVQSVVCSDSGILDISIDKCFKAFLTECPAGTSLDNSTGLCLSSPICTSGTYVQASNRCEAAVTRSCGATYIWDAVVEKCVQAPTCPADPNYSLSSTIAYSPNLDKCISQAMHTCPGGTTWATLPIGKCEAAPICDGAVYYDATANQCLISAACPYGPQFSCMQNPNSGVFQCSPNPCIDTGGGGDVDITDPLDPTYYDDDGDRDADGNCLGTVYIFSGKPGRCRPPGWTVGMINNCCEKGDVMPENTGSSLGLMTSMYDLAKMTKAMYDAAQAFDAVSKLMDQGMSASAALYETMYTASQSGMSEAALDATYIGAKAASEGASQATAMSNAAINAGKGLAAAAIVYAVGAIIKALGGDQDAVMVGSSAAMLAMIAPMMGALLSGPQAIIGVIIIVIMRVLMGTGCEPTDIMTAGQVKSGRCHFVGDYCEKQWALVGCVQQAKGYCCFNSMLARIINEQGRPQLSVFGPTGGWGEANKPECRGLTPDEFQALDFHKIDLSEYFDVVQKDLDAKIQASQQNITNSIQQRFQDIQGVPAN